MLLTLFTMPGPEKQKELLALVGECRKKDPVTLSFPMEEDSFWILNYQKNELVSAAEFIPLQEDLYECRAFTAPQFRCQGFFSEILEEGISKLPGDTDLLFSSDQNSEDTGKAISALEASLISQEFMMELEPEDRKLSSLSCHPDLVLSSFCDEDGTRITEYQNETGEAYIAHHNSFSYFYGFEIREDLRGRGIGTAFFHAVLNHYFEECSSPLRLQVSGENTPACHLYEKTGFRITDTLLSYLY